MLTAFWLARCSAGVHQEKGIFGLHGNGIDDAIAIILNDVVDEIIALHNHWRIGSKSVGITLPDQHLVDVLAFLLRGGNGKFGTGLVIDPPAVAMIAVGINQNATARVPARNPQASPEKPPKIRNEINPAERRPAS
jgi:hypothetical protein